MSTQQGASSKDPVSIPGPKPSQPKQKQIANYAIPPINYGLSEHYHHYGWPVTDEMLSKIFVKLNLRVPRPDVRAGTLGHHLMRRLRFPGGISYVYCKPDEYCEKQNRVLLYKEEGKPDMIHVTFFSIGCTYSKKYYWRRPTQEAFETLINLFGEQPRWLEDYFTKQEFQIETIEWW